MGFDTQGLAKTFLDVGAGAVVAYKNSVLVTYEAAAAENFFNHMAAGYHVKDSMIYAKEKKRL